MPQNASAQYNPPEPTPECILGVTCPPPGGPQPGWVTSVIDGPNESYQSADEACKRQHESYNPAAEYQSPIRVSFKAVSCRWLMEPPANSILPAGVDLICPEYWKLVRPGKCVQDQFQENECDCEPGATSQSAPGIPTVGNPISLATGSKVETETDYETADGLLDVVRRYRSNAFEKSTIADQPVPGFGQNWHGIIPGRLSAFHFYGVFDRMEYMTERGTRHEFVATDSSTTDWTYWTHGTNRHKISRVGNPTETRSDFFTGPTPANTAPAEFRMDMSNGDYILFRRSNDYDDEAKYRYLVPVEQGLASGYKKTFIYADGGQYPTSVVDSFGRTLTLSWAAAPTQYPKDGGFFSSNIDNGVKVIDQIILPDATKLKYTYDSTALSFMVGAKDRLSKVERLSPSNLVLWSRSYLYEQGGHLLTGKVDQNGNRLSTHYYNAEGRARVTQRAGGVDRHDVSYSRPLYTQNFNVDVINPLGHNLTYKFFEYNIAPPSIPKTLEKFVRAGTAQVEEQVTTIEFEAPDGTKRMFRSTVDPKGNRTTFINDIPNYRADSQIEAQDQAVIRTTDFSWHPTLDLKTREEREGLRINYSYSPSGQLLSRTETDTTTHILPYATTGQVRNTTYAWNAVGRLLSVNGPLPVDAQGKDDTLTFAYDAVGNMISMTNGLGHMTSYSGHDPNGRPAQMTDLNGIITAFTYDGLGRLTQINKKHPTSAANDTKTLIDYDVEGRVTGITPPATAKLFFDYNLAGQMTAVRAADGERIDFTYDRMGNMLTRTVMRVNGTANNSLSRTYDTLGRMLTETLGVGRTSTWTYDKNDNPTRVISPRSHATDMAFDAFNRLVQTAYPDGGTETVALDLGDNVTSFTDPATVQTTFVVNGFGDVLQEVSPDRGTSTYYYNAAGQMTASIDGRGQRINYLRDILGRVTKKTPVGRPATEVITYSYDAGGIGSYQKGNLTKIADGNGTTSFQYDHRGNMLVKRQAIGTTTTANLSYAYNLGDKITQITYPSGRIVGYVRDAKNRITTVRTKAASSVTTWTNLMTGLQYEAFASLRQGAFGNTLSFAADWGNDGRLASRRVYKTSGGVNVSRLAYAYDASDNMTGITDSVVPSRSTVYGYDPVDRLSRIDGALAGGMAREDLLHDQNGNRTGVERRVSATDMLPSETHSYTKSAGTNRLASVTTPAGTRSIGYDARGNTITEARPGAVNVTASYDGHGRLTAYAQGATSLGHGYNGLDDRTSTTSSGVTTRFLYDPSGRIIGEYGANATDVKAEHIWLNPESGEEGLHGGDDGTGGYTPIAMAQAPAGGTASLHWVHSNHLGVPLLTTDATGTASTPTGHTALGFPGQTRTLADLWYNRYRDYDPTTGRYIQADPIGLDGDVNPFGYASANPLKFVDPDGLKQVTRAARGPNPAARQLNLPQGPHLRVPQWRPPESRGGGVSVVSRPGTPSSGYLQAAQADAFGICLRPGQEGYRYQYVAYVHNFASGKRYFGMGTSVRPRRSAQDLMRRTGDRVSSTDWTFTPTRREAAIQESIKLQQGGTHGSNSNYNQRNSPGTSYREQDGRQ